MRDDQKCCRRTRSNTSFGFLMTHSRSTWYHYFVLLRVSKHRNSFFKKYPSSATELPSDSVAYLVRAWQAICQLTGSSPSLSRCLFFPLSFLSSFSLNDFDQVKVWLSCLEHVNNRSCTSRFALVAPTHRTCQLGICFSWIPGSSALSTQTQPLECRVTL